MINVRMQPSEVKRLFPKILVIGVGGAGGNAVNNMISTNLEGVEFLVCNTDAQALDSTLCEHRIQLGSDLTGGLGAGAKPEIGKGAAEESLADLERYLENTNMVFITAGFGGGTGTGAAPVVARAARERGILTVGVITKPFHFEGSHRMKQAEAGIEEMQGYVDTLIVIPNQNLFRIANEKTTFAEAFKMADGVLQSGVRGVTDLIIMPGLINLDFADIRSAMQEMGKAMMGTGEAEGDKRSVEAAEAAINNPLLDDVSMKGARGVIINVTGGYDMTLFEADEACNRIREEVDPAANIIFGATFDEKMEGSMRVSVVATGIDSSEQRRSITGSGSAIPGRAQPNTQDQAGEERQQASEGQPSSVTGARAFTPASGITSSIPAAPSRNAVEAQAAAAGPDEPESDMFEQQEYTPQAQSETGESTIKNTVLRGATHGGAFIPPRPVMAQNSTEKAGYGPQFTSFHQQQEKQQDKESDVPAQAGTSGFNEQPPQTAAGVTAGHRRTPSLFERITGSRREEAGEVAENATGDTELRAPQRPSQGRLNIDAGPSRPAASQEDELDIPAFLRRQAN